MILNLFAKISGLLLLVLLAAPAWAQTPLNPNQPFGTQPFGTQSQTQMTDTAGGRALTRPLTKEEKRSKIAADSAKRTERLFGLRLTRPAKAGLLAVVLPGAGQIYNRRWWKLPLVYGALGGVIAGEVFYQRRFSEYKRAFNLIAERKDTIGGELLGPRARLERSPEALQSGIVFYRGYRDVFYLYIGLAYGMQILDAVVDAHLREFDVSDDLALSWDPALLPIPGQTSRPTAPGLSFTLRVK
ncbi:DUF5683 domain-containing protein [Hymenobacter sp. ASUV-10]|uniref:DUF5683 domain-containing protein n=1 Tax=Hymenobacter aranciens TaxID=3063996 RepID=A0ABT9BH36_9BACT|nr:DUF5683 domain-containing protein [Hymenobacter sp. ASUV-10]MDO7876983.1 DUF5683 domain-containing protein [Hymenobacter sp. ASUV-10]